MRALLLEMLNPPGRQIFHLVSKAGAELVASAGRSLLPERELRVASGEQLEVELGQVRVERVEVEVEVEVERVEHVVGQGDAKAEAGRPHLGKSKNERRRNKIF